MDNKQLLDEAVEELLKENDGVNPNSSVPIEEQLEKKKAEYREYLELKPFKLRIEKAFEVIQDEMSDILEEDKFDVLVSELVDAGETLTENPEMQGEKLGISKENFAHLFSLGETLLKKNETEKAAALFTLLTVLDPSWFRHWFFLGMAFQDLKDYKEAIKAYEKANKITEDSPLPHFFLAECFIALDDLQNASVHFEKAKEIVATLPAHPDFEDLISELEARIK